ncbi:MAG: sulfite exporter TauE/SafE family protein [Spirochaetales bacterium]|nr:sulfite exporter TauE/SafE family protein [Spirochaetales bacterium]
MDQNIMVLLLTTLSVGFVHTLIGPDHFVPFIVLSKSRNWSMTKTITITALCGIGHVLSAVILGLGATSIGSLLKRLDLIEFVRGEIAAWLLISFGFVYCIWGVRSALKNKTHSHCHVHAGGLVPHEHTHSHHFEHSHLHESKGKKEMTPWILFIIFVFGPCEPLIPLVMYPAVQVSMINVLLVTLAFGLTTLAVMLGLVISSSYGLKRLLRFPFFERYGNALAGGMICTCGLAMTFLGF